MGYSNCCRLCMQSLLSEDYEVEYFTTSETISGSVDESPLTLQQVIEECFQVMFTEHETVTKVCRNCFSDVLLVDGIRKRVLVADDLLKRYYSEILAVRDPEVQDTNKVSENGKDKHPLEVEQVDDEIEEEYVEQQIDYVRLKKEKLYRKIPAVVKKVVKFTCYICETNFESREMLDQHLSSHIMTMSPVCHLCDFQPNGVRHFNVHLYRAHFRKGRLFPCEICEKNGTKVQLTSNFRLQAHIKRFHMGIVTTPVKKFVCTYCGKGFARSSMLKMHENGHIKAMIYRCQFCTTFTTNWRSNLVRHERTHGTNKPYKCDQCDAAFTVSTYLDHHKKVHSDERPFPCTLCDASYKNKSALKRHLQIHEKHPNPADMHKLAGKPKKPAANYSTRSGDKRNEMNID